MSDMAPSQPLALRLGCTCPSAPVVRSADEYDVVIVSAGCPLHDPQTGER